MNFLHCGYKSALSLLVHLGPWGYSVDAEEESLLGENAEYDLINLLSYKVEHFLLRLGLLLVERNATGMDDPIHVDL